MLDHITVTVRRFAASKDFYTKALAPLGYSVKMGFDNACGFGDFKPWFWLEPWRTTESPPATMSLCKVGANTLRELLTA